MSPLEIYWYKPFIMVGKIATLVIFITAIIALSNKKNFNKPLYYFFFYLLATIGCNFLEHLVYFLASRFSFFVTPILNYFEIENTIFLEIFFNLKDFVLIGLFYFSIISDRKIKTYIFRLSCFCAMVAIFNYLFIEGYQELGIINPLMNSLFVILLPLFYLVYSQKYSLHISLIKNPYFWICLGLIIPNILGLFQYLAGDYFHRDNFILFCKFQILKNILNIIGQILIAIGFYHSYYARFIKIA